MRAATEGNLPPVMPQGNLVEVLGCEVRQGLSGELMVESSPCRQRRPPCKTNKEMSDEAADAAALTYLLVYLTIVWTRANRWKTITPNTKRINGLYPPTQRSFQPFAILSNCFSSLAWVTGQGRSWGRGFGTGRHSETLQAPPCAQPGGVFGKCLPGFFALCVPALPPGHWGECLPRC